jgi:hypothetical protein
MKRIGIILFGIVFLALSARAQERKIEIAPFAGGYFSAGFQSFQRVGFGPIILAPGQPLQPTVLPITPRELKPVDEPASGIFGIRASYDLSRRFTLEGTFGFSPAGRQFTPVFFPRIASGLADGPFQPTPPRPGQPQPVPQPGQGQAGAIIIPALAPAIRGNDTFHYAGNVLFRWPGARGWTPFITGGLGGITRTAEVVAIPRPPIRILQPGPIPAQPTPVAPIAISAVVPAPIDTDLAVNFGAGIKKYFSSRCGIRFDFRDYLSKVDGDTVHNLEASLGVIFRF